MSRGAGGGRSSAGTFPPFLLFLLWLVAVLVAPTASLALPPCSDSSAGWCVARRFAGTVRNGELGFRFGGGLDATGDGVPDVAGGTRFKPDPNDPTGVVTVWSGADGSTVFDRDGIADGALFGHASVLVPDLDGDGLADLVVSAPRAKLGAELAGEITAWSPKRGARLWGHRPSRPGALGWHLELAGDQDGDGIGDVFAGVANGSPGSVELVSGRDGSMLRRYEPPEPREGFGWYFANVGDQDGDRRSDLLVGGARRSDVASDARPRVFLLSSASGKKLRSWSSDDAQGGFGEVVAAAGDVDGDGKKEIVVAAPSMPGRGPGEVQIFSSRDGREIRRFEGVQAGELYGRMVTNAGDVDGDGTEDLAIGAPWHAVGTFGKVGRVELRSGKTGDILAQWTGDKADEWCGWHIRRTPDPDGRGRPALLVSCLRQKVGHKDGAGVIDLVVQPGKIATRH